MESQYSGYVFIRSKREFFRLFIHCESTSKKAGFLCLNFIIWIHVIRKIRFSDLLFVSQGRPLLFLDQGALFRSFPTSRDFRSNRCSVKTLCFQNPFTSNVLTVEIDFPIFQTFQTNKTSCSCTWDLYGIAKSLLKNLFQWIEIFLKWLAPCRIVILGLSCIWLETIQKLKTYRKVQKAYELSHKILGVRLENKSLVFYILLKSDLSNLQNIHLQNLTICNFSYHCLMTFYFTIHRCPLRTRCF